MAIDLEHFPTSETAKRMMRRVSPVYDRSYVAKWLYQVMGLEWDQVREVMDSLWAQPFLEQATWGLRYWEQAYGLPTDETKSYEERRRLVAAKKTECAPVNPARLEEILQHLTGCPVTVTENIAPYTFQAALHIVAPGTVNYDAVYKKIRQIKPSHQSVTLCIQFRTADIPLHIGVIAGLRTTIPIPQVRDDLSISEAVRMGGTPELIHSAAVPEICETLSRTVRIGQAGEVQITLPQPEQL